MPATRLRWLVSALGALIVLATVVGYSPSLRGAFQFDDEDIFAPRFTSLEDLAEPSTWVAGLTGSDRPLTRLTFAANRLASGFDPAPWHATNLALHLAAAALAFAFVRRTLRRVDFAHPDLAAALAAGLFALHPLHTQAVSYLSQRAEVLASALVLATLELLAASDDVAPGRRRMTLRAVALGVFAAALTSKQIAATLPALWLLHVAVLPPATERQDGPVRCALRRLPAVLPFLTLSAVAMLGGVLGTRSSQTAGLNIGFLPWDKYALTQLRVVPTYLRLLAWPTDLNVDRTFPSSHGLVDPPTTLAGAAFLMALVGAAFVAERWSRGRVGEGAGLVRFAGFGAVFFLVALLPSSGVVPLADVIEEHRVYLASLGVLAPAAAAATHAIAAVGTRWRAAGLAGAAALLVALATATFERNHVWQTELSLWTDAAEKSPDKSRVQMNLGAALARAGRYEEALVRYRDAFRLARDHAISIIVLYRNEAASLGALGRHAEAATLLEKLMKLGGAEPDTVNDLALAYFNQGRLEEAEKLVRNLIAHIPDLAGAHDLFGQILLNRGDVEGARAECLIAARLSPFDGLVWSHLGDAAVRLGRFPEACHAYGEAAALDSSIARAAHDRYAALGCLPPR